MKMKGKGSKMKTNFGNYLKELRLKAGFGLRKFANLIEMPASNLSAIEHGRRTIPKEKLFLAAEVLGLESGTDEWDYLFDLSSQADQLPADVEQIANRGFIPALLRTIDNKQLTEADIEKLIKEIQNKDERTQTESS
jgi:transcriptional regulator with XRE-family HTH domain